MKTLILTEEEFDRLQYIIDSWVNTIPETDHVEESIHEKVYAKVDRETIRSVEK